MAKAVVMATWDDVPHLTEAQKAEMLDEIPPFQRDARSKGVPQLGAGAIYPVPESEFVIDPIRIPRHWPRCYGMDVGWRVTAALWCALDRSTDTLYVTAEHYRSQAEPSVHAAAILARGKWIPGTIDPASRGRSPIDGQQLMAIYNGLGLNLTPADNSVESGLYDVWIRLSTGRIKVFRTCTKFLEEYRLYRRDEKGRIVKERDHLMDCWRYAVRTGRDIATVEPAPAWASAAAAHVIADSDAGY